MATPPNPAENLQKALRGKFIALKIGSQYYNSLDDLQTEYGKELINETLLTKLGEYFIQKPEIRAGESAHTYIEDSKDQALIKPFLDSRIKILKADGRLKYDNSLVGNRKRKILKELETLSDSLNKPDPNKDTSSKVDVKRDEIIQLLLTTLWKFSSIQKDTVKIQKNWKDILEAADKMPPDELLKEAGTVNKPGLNAFKKFIKGEIAPSEVKEEGGKPIKGTKVAKINLLKLLALFKAQQAMSPILNSNDENTLDGYIASLQQEIPEIVENVRLSYRSVTRFFRDRYLRTMNGLTELLKTITLAKYPIDTMIRVVFIMTELERYVWKGDGSLYPDLFPAKTGLIRLTNLSPADTEQIINIINKYKEYAEKTGLTNSVKDLDGTDTINYELIQMHTRKAKKPTLVKAILQLVRGEILMFNKSKLDDTIEELKGKLPGKESDLGVLKTKIGQFFNDRPNPKDTLYISYQESPENLLEDTSVKIKQLGELPFFIVDVDGKKLGKDSSPLLTTVDVNTILKDISKLKDFPFTFEKFGITTTKPLQLVHSITQLTGTLLNTVYINDALKNKTPKKNA
jgi:hypothetical protein